MMEECGLLGTTPVKPSKRSELKFLILGILLKQDPLFQGPYRWSYGGTITIPTPNAADITKVSLVKSISYYTSL